MPVGVPTSLPHGLQRPAGVAVIPDIVTPGEGGANFTVTADATNVTVTNNGPAAADLDVEVESWHSFERSFPAGAIALTPQPFVANAAAGLGVQLNQGNTVLVDQVFGDDATGQREGRPFATVAAALAVAQAGDAVIVRPGTYELAAGITLPTAVFLVGNTSRVILQMTNVTADTTLVTMGVGSQLVGIRLILTSAEHHTLVGIDFPGATAASARATTIKLEIDNSGAGAGDSDVIGVRSNGTGVSPTYFENLDNVNITVESIGGGTKRGILVGGANTFEATDTIVQAVGVGIGIETADASAVFIGQALIIDGADADISQTAGSLRVGGATDLANVDANGLGFGTLFHPNTLIFGDPAALPNGTRFLYPGASPASATEVFVRLPAAAVVKGLSVRVTTPPGGADSCVITVRRNGVDTALAVTLTGAQTSGVNSSVSVGFAAGDTISIKTVETGATQDIIVVVELF